MTKRSVDEIKQDIVDIQNEYRKLRKQAYLSKERRVRWGGNDVSELNKMLSRIRNLKNELNQAMIRDWWNPQKRG